MSCSPHGMMSGEQVGRCLPDRSGAPPVGHRKRKRVPVACRSCRLRKSRCDGGEPCSTCQDTDTACQYDRTVNRPRAEIAPEDGLDTNAGLRARNDLLERRLQSIEERLTSLAKDRQEGASRGRCCSQDEPEDTVATAEDDRDSSGSTEPLQQDDVDGMGAVALRDSPYSGEFFGNSSNIGFLGFITHALSRSQDPLDSAGPAGADPTGDGQGWPACFSAALGIRRDAGDAVSSQRPAATQRRKAVQPFTLPQQQDADALLNFYFSTVNLMIPIIHEESFRAAYQKMRKNGPRRVRRTWLAILNVIFALADNVSTPTSPPRERAEQANTYFERALELARSTLLGGTSLELVQLFLLMERYLEGTTHSSLAWTFHSLSVKGAYQLGLHSAEPRNLSQLDREARRRLWYHCTVADRWLSATYGRPALISLSHMTPEPSSHMPFSIVSAEVTSSSLAFFDGIVGIAQITGEAVDCLYGQTLGFHDNLSTNDTMNEISRLCWKLARWQDSLPAYLRVLSFTNPENVTSGSSPPVMMSFRVILSLQYHGTRIFVLRPVLRKLLEQQGVGGFHNTHQSRWLLSSGATLLSDLVCTCRDILNISRGVLNASQDDRNIQGAWWLSSFFTFNASLAILGILIVKRVPSGSTILPDWSETDLRGLIEMALDTLHELDGGAGTVKHCRDTLSHLVSILETNAHPSGLALTTTLPVSAAWPWPVIDTGLFGSEGVPDCIPGMGHIHDILRL